jgi:hypothetical protein
MASLFLFQLLVGEMAIAEKTKKVPANFFSMTNMKSIVKIEMIFSNTNKKKQNKKSANRIDFSSIRCLDIKIQITDVPWQRGLVG